MVVIDQIPGEAQSKEFRDAHRSNLGNGETEDALLMQNNIEVKSDPGYAFYISDSLYMSWGQIKFFDTYTATESAVKDYNGTYEWIGGRYIRTKQ